MVYQFGTIILQIQQFFHGKKLGATQRGILLIAFSVDELRPFIEVLKMEKCFHFSNPLRFSPYDSTSVMEM